MDKTLFEYLLRLGDSSLILSQRLGAWTGHGPILEEDLALTNTALDLLGQARMWLTLAGEVEGAGRDEDALAYLRDAHQFHNVLLAERPNGNYADTMARQFLFDVWHYFLLQRLEQSSDERVAAIAAKSIKEVTYHVRRSSDLVVRLGDGTEHSHQRMLEAIPLLWRFTVELISGDDSENHLHDAGLIADPAQVASAWQATVTRIFASATLPLPAPPSHFYLDARRGLHSEHLGILLAEMQALPRAYPDATW